MKVGTITFHGAHNYGSMLQAYALQKAIASNGIDCEIINFRTEAQKRMYRVITGRKRLGPMLKDLSHIPFYYALKNKYQLFELFLNEYLVTSVKEYATLKDLEQASLDYDIVVCGSDQIWKAGIEDFDYAYLLPFTSAKKVSYAASFGPTSEFPMSFAHNFKEKLSDFSSISVREEGTKKVITEISGRDDISVVCDPVFLLKCEQWLELIDSEPIVHGDYIFFYTLFADAEMIKMVKAVSRHYGIKVVTSNFTNQHDVFVGFERRYDCGPREFLNLIKNAKYVCTSSFHGSALSLILNKQLISIRGMKDNRISSILIKGGIQNCVITSVEDVQHLPKVLIPDYDIVDNLIIDYAKSGWDFIKKNILNND